MIPVRVLRGLADGSIDRAFRRWDAPRVRAGGTQRTGAGVVAFESVEQVGPEDLTEEDAARAGFGSLDALRAALDRRPDRPIFRIRLRLAGPDPRVELRETIPDAQELEEVALRLARLDAASRQGPWTFAVLQAIHDRPNVPAVELAASFGREKMHFKLDVRKLKELGLTESLRPGYRLSKRGVAVLSHLADRR